jgi:hypothetical protein
MQHDKKQLEILLINYFRESYADFPKGKLSPSESPDFIVKMKNTHELGIELTRLNPINKNMPDKDQLTQIEIREEIIDLSQKMFEQNSEFKLFVKFLFSDRNPVLKEKLLITAAQSTNAIRKAIQNKNTQSFFKVSIPGNFLPEGVDEILIVHHPEMQSSIWERANNLGVSNNVVDDIRQAILKKDEKLKLYQRQRLNYYWLLIFTDRLRGVKNFNLANKIMNHHFKSHFQQVFLFDLIKSDIYRLI